MIPQAMPIQLVIPEIVLAGAGCLCLLLGAMKSQAARRSIPYIALLALVVDILLTVFVFKNQTGAGAGLVFGSVTAFARTSALVLGVLLVLANWSQAKPDEEGEYVAMMLFSLAGLLLVAPAENLVLLFSAIELVSIPTYVLVVLSRRNLKALEAGTKYFYLGALSAAILAYGMSFLYGVGGSIDLSTGAESIRAALHGERGPYALSLALLGIGLTLGGLFFKIAAAPLHFYIADVYEGAANGVAGLLGFVPKFAGLLAIFKILSLTGVWYGTTDATFVLIWIAAALSMTLGNILAFRQDNLKRMLAYSGVAHSGYMLVAVLAGPMTGDSGSVSNGLAAVLYYAVIYGIANLACFVILGVLKFRGLPCESLREVGGLLRREPALALLLAVAMLTLMGVPPLPGFWGKLGLFGSALAVAQSGGERSTWLVVLVVVALLNTAIAAAYYLRVVAALLLYEQDETAEADPLLEAQSLGAYICGVLLLIFAVFPSVLMNSSLAATNSVMNAATPQIAQRPAASVVVASQGELNPAKPQLSQR